MGLSVSVRLPPAIFEPISLFRLNLMQRDGKQEQSCEMRWRVFGFTSHPRGVNRLGKGRLGTSKWHRGCGDRRQERFGVRKSSQKGADSDAEKATSPGKGSRSLRRACLCT